MRRFLVAIVGLIFLAVAVFMFVRGNTLAKNCTEETEATVVDMKQELDTDADSTSTYRYYPIVEYSAGGKTVRATMSSGSSTPAYSINEKIAILYDPNDTKEFIVKGETKSVIFTVVFAVLGVFVTAYGVRLAVKKE